MKSCSLILLFLIPINIYSQEFSSEGKKAFPGLFNFYYDEHEDKIYLEVDKLNEDFLYIHSLSSGIGSNDIGLDRGQLGGEKVVYFKKAGHKLLLVQPNLKYRVSSQNELERKSVEQAFAKSILYGFPIVDEIKNGHYIIDITGFLLQDTHGVVEKLQETGQGDYRLDLSKSALSLTRTRAFPKNVEFEAELTFAGKPESWEIRSVVPHSSLVTVVQHHSFVQLPEKSFEMRRFDPRSGSFPFVFYDYSTPVNEPTEQRFIYRHRLEKKDPTAEVSEPVEPIIYYLDNGTPEPIRSALLEGGRWWNDAFEAIGYRNAFQVKLLPEEADPMDIRYNVIQWVHRSSRGWSYGSSVSDPRTGEILKGHVSLGSLRIRQDFLIAQALMNKPYKEKDDNDDKMLQLALARIRQLSAHEIGHTLGFAHNFSASTQNRASVMDYPHPYIDLDDQTGKLDFSDAYDKGIGEWDKVSVAYAYQDFPEGTKESDLLDQILLEAYRGGLQFITDQDARPAGGAHVSAHLWDNGGDAVSELERVLKIRDVAIRQFSIYNIKNGRSYSELEDVFVPLYFFHRYQTEATTKLIGGLEYNYAIRGDGQSVVKALPRDQQIAALKAVLKTVNASRIVVPEKLLDLFPPRIYGNPRTRESFQGKTGVAFDAISAAGTAADYTLQFLFHPARASRLVQQKALDNGQLSLDEVIDFTFQSTMSNGSQEGYIDEVQNMIAFRFLDHLMNLAQTQEAYPQVHSITMANLVEIRAVLSGRKDKTAKEMVRRISQFLENPVEYRSQYSLKIPDGSPIGMGGYDGNTCVVGF